MCLKVVEVVWRACSHVAQMLMLMLITGWFWCWKRLRMHRKDAHTQVVLQSTWKLGLWPVT